MVEYRCIKKLVVPELDDPEGIETRNEYIVDVGEIWEKVEESSYMLTNQDGKWLNIDGDMVDEYFEKLKEDE